MLRSRTFAWLGSTFATRGGRRSVLGTRTVSLRRMLLTRLRRGWSLLATPLLDDGRQNGPARAGGSNVNVGRLVRSFLEVLVQWACVRAVEEDGGVGASSRLPRTDVVARLLANEFEDIGTNVEATESVKVPVGLNSADLGVVVVVAIVACALEMFRDSIAKENAKNAVGLWVSSGLVEGDENKSAVPKA